MTGDDWETWLAIHGPALVLYARGWTRCQADAEDIVQEAFVRFWRSRHQAADRTAYLFACVRNTAREWLRSDARLKRREQAAAVNSPVREPMFVSPSEGDQRRATIETALGTLPEPQREVLVLKVWAGLSFAQIASALSISPNTAASRYRYALARLREQLAEAMIQE